MLQLNESVDLHFPILLALDCRVVGGGFRAKSNEKTPSVSGRAEAFLLYEFVKITSAPILKNSRRRTQQIFHRFAL